MSSKQLEMFGEVPRAYTWEPDPSKRLVASYGSGVDSTAFLVDWVRRVRRGDTRYLPRHIVFADTGGERPETYDYLSYFSNWLVSQGFPRITTVRAGGKYAVSEVGGLETPTGLEEKCRINATLPAIAFGFKTCSDNFKRQPITKWLRARQKRRGEKLAGIECAIGFDASELRRVKVGAASGDQYDRAFPLMALGWDRDECKAQIAAEGLQVPPKSACFFCPSSKQPEIQELAVLHPDLAARAIVMEQAATGEGGKCDKLAGLGRSKSWTPILVAANAGLAAHITEK